MPVQSESIADHLSGAVIDKGGLTAFERFLLLLTPLPCARLPGGTTLTPFVTKKAAF